MKEKSQLILTNLSTNNLNEVFASILKEKKALNQVLLQNHLASLIEKKIAQINDLNEIIIYWSLSPINSKARLLLQTKFSQMLSNYSYEEIQEIKTKRLRGYQPLQDLIEERKKLILPDYLAKINTAKKVETLISKEDLNSRVVSLLQRRYSELISPRLDNLHSLNDLIATYSLVSKDSKERKIIEKKIQKKIDDISDFSFLFLLYVRFFIQVKLQEMTVNSLNILLEKTKNDIQLKEKLGKLTIREIPKELVNLVTKYL